MLFSSAIFLYFFLPAVLIVYYLLLRRNRKWQNIFLTAASLVFYAWGGVRFVFIMLLSIVVNWFMGLLVAEYKNKNRVVVAKTVLIVSVVLNLLILFVFKYLSFSLTTVKEIWNLNMWIPRITLPIGISFFTFQAISYVIDVYRGKGKVQKNIINVGLYITLFPQLVAGPIVRYDTVADEIENRKETLDDFSDGFARLIVGMAKKVLIANKLAVIADSAFSSVESISVASSWLGAICYTYQIFFDFSGYSDMAIGLGRMFGFHFLENFDYPYISCSITEFWRRWHISLGSWFRDYVYIPLGGSRVKKHRLVWNLFVVWILTGIWHGANWTFVAWGLMYFILLTVEKLTGIATARPRGIGAAIRWVYTMAFVVLGWVVFRADSLTVANTYIRTMFGLEQCTWMDAAFYKDLSCAGAVLCAATIFSIPVTRWKWIRECTVRPVFQILYSALLLILFIASILGIVSSAHNPFIYFNF